MNINKSGVAFLLLCSINCAAHFPSEPSAEAFREADAHFTYHHKMINPYLVELFEGWVSDSGVPTVVSVDISAADQTNQFGDNEVIYNAAGAAWTVQDKNASVPKQFNYRWIGRLANGLHVVELSSSGGGGTMVATTLFFFRFSEGKGWRPSPLEGDNTQPSRLLEAGRVAETPYRRLLMSIERYYILGDRVAAAYAIHGNDLTVKFTNQSKAVEKVIHGTAAGEGKGQNVSVPKQE